MSYNFETAQAKAIAKRKKYFACAKFVRMKEQNL